MFAIIMFDYDNKFNGKTNMTKARKNIVNINIFVVRRHHRLNTCYGCIQYTRNTDRPTSHQIWIKYKICIQIGLYKFHSTYTTEMQDVSMFQCFNVLRNFIVIFSLKLLDVFCILSNGEPYVILLLLICYVKANPLTLSC